VVNPKTGKVLGADSVTLHVLREKDGKLRLAYSGLDDAKVRE
jgi:hypothetical protein